MAAWNALPKIIMHKKIRQEHIFDLETRIIRNPLSLWSRWCKFVLACFIPCMRKTLMLHIFKTLLVLFILDSQNYDRGYRRGISWRKCMEALTLLSTSKQYFCIRCSMLQNHKSLWLIELCILNFKTISHPHFLNNNGHIQDSLEEHPVVSHFLLFVHHFGNLPNSTKRAYVLLQDLMKIVLEPRDSGLDFLWNLTGTSASALSRSL